MAGDMSPAEFRRHAHTLADWTAAYFETIETRAVLSQVKPGDVFLAKVRSNKLNHGGVMTSDGRILHHLPHRLSSRENSSLWARGAHLWIRYEQ